MKWKEIIPAMIVFLIFTIIFAPSSTAWSWETHSNIAEAVYYGLPPEIQNNLNLELMKNASNDPDEKFKDFTYHSYPKSYEKAKTWLDKGKTAYDKGEYGEASTDYGIASHYISDTFSAPHGVSKEASSDHTKYEDTSSKLKPVATYKSGDLNTILQEGYTQGGGSWNEWLQTKNSDIIQKNLNDGASASLSAIQDSINSTASPNLISSLYSFILNIFNIH